MKVVLCTPNKLNKPIPVLMRRGIGEIEDEHIEVSNIQSYGRLNNGNFLNNDLGVVCIQGGEVKDYQISFKNSLYELLYSKNQSWSRADKWGVSAEISSLLSYSMDLLGYGKLNDHYSNKSK